MYIMKHGILRPQQFEQGFSLFEALIAALIVAIAVAGVIGYWWSGRGVAGLPEGSWGFIYLPAVAILAVATMIAAPWGVKLSHQLSADKLKKGFGVLLLVIAARMLWQVIQG